MPEPVLQALTGRADLQPYAGNRLLLFALELSLRIEDIHSVALNSLTDGSDDKKCDLVYVDRTLGKAIIAQGYIAIDESRPEAPANKASDLNTAVSWLLGRDLAVLPARIRPAAEELDSAIVDGEITSIEIWYCHNLPESANVQHELDRVQATASTLLTAKYPDSRVDSVTTVEVGRARLQQWYSATQVAILVADRFEVEITGGFQESGDKWVAFCTSVPASWLRALWKDHGTNLFSTNVRDYLGSRRSDKNINNNIKGTAQTQPQRFWAYNNGLTALVNDYGQIERDGKTYLTINGISIVNGAQTTGALSSVPLEAEGAVNSARVLARFVKCSDAEVVRGIIRFNNSQNQVEITDFRSGDQIQERLRAEFRAIPEADYRGGRRGSERDQIERPPNLIPTSTASQALVAFHQEPNTAYNERGRIWESDEVYGRYFSDKTSARHMLLCYSLLRAIEAAKRGLQEVPESHRTETQRRQADYFRRRGSSFLLLSALAACLETFLGRAIPDTFALLFTANESPRSCAERWAPMVALSLSFVEFLDSAVESDLKNRDKVRDAITKFRSLVDATRVPNQATLQEFAKHVSG